MNTTNRVDIPVIVTEGKPPAQAADTGHRRSSDDPVFGVSDKRIQSFQWFLACSALLMNACDLRKQDGSAGKSEQGYSSEWLAKHTDYGEKIHELGRPSLWESDRMELGFSRFTASVGPNVYQDEDNEDPDFDSMNIEFDHDGGSIVLFSRELAVDELPDGFASLKASDVVKFDRDTRTVDFRVGNHPFSYQLPEPQNH